MSDISPLRDRYINPLTDFGFKRLFGTEVNKTLLIDFLNVVLPAQHRVKDLTFRNTENLGNTIVGLYCESQLEEKFIVELQKANHNYFRDRRSNYYSSFSLEKQARIENAHDKAPIYAIGILGFIFGDHKHENTLLHIVGQKDQDSHDQVTYIYIELPKFTKTLNELENHFDQWLFILRSLSTLDDQPLSLKNSIFKQLFGVTQIASLSRTERQAYETSLKYYRDMMGVVETARQEGYEQGIKKGVKLSIAQAMKRSGSGLDFIAQVTGLSAEDLQNLDH